MMVVRCVLSERCVRDDEEHVCVVCVLCTKIWCGELARATRPNRRPTAKPDLPTAQAVMDGRLTRALAREYRAQRLGNLGNKYIPNSPQYTQYIYSSIYIYTYVMYS